jgi:3-deoxy-D-manno-octulosonate 8-phosphate phosphatase (KDO 8-P phosphatase)
MRPHQEHRENTDNILLRSSKVEQCIKKISLVVFDFDGVFTDNRVLVLQDGSEGVFCSRADGFGLEALRKVGIHLLVISKEINPVVTARCRKLNLPCIQSCDDKVSALREAADKLSINLKNTAFMGNDINDLECMKIVGLPVCVADSHKSVLKAARYRTKAKGGYGAVREFCDFVAQVRTGEKKKTKAQTSKK